VLPDVAGKKIRDGAADIVLFIFYISWRVM